ncbi:phosphonate ABC transporter ATP-binding protein [Ruania alba]|uniref:Phosphonate transport system ATP-binding protein n=1 Tax=Ruania alba TaxID=648782 RepID=A0A1H5LZU7_9MICO|nr:phosphonate ABC transporter ATP-binding protein [Ruania alba]SEE82522.1 phosphonate transport system ATP-binding protein [Ruania alba]
MATVAPSRTAPTTGPDQPPAIALTGVTKQFTETVRGLDDVSVEIPVGQRTVLLGRSGSGKSTMLRHINRLQEPTAGTVAVHGTALSSLSRRGIRAVRRDIGFIFQNFHLVGSMTALENVCTGMLGSLWGPRMGLWSYPREGRRRALDQLDRVGLADRAFQRADTLSGGQQQRVAIARALIQEPSILLADEPVASLDPESSAGVLEVLTRISAEDRLTVVCSLHQVDLALGFAERVIGLREGKVVFDDSADDLTREQAMAIYRAEATA